MPELLPNISTTFDIISWNILLDQTRVDEGLITSQSDRIPSQIQTLKNLSDLGISPDVVGICEAELTKDGEQNGKLIAEAVAAAGPGYWYMHNSSRRKHEREFIGLFGTLVTDAEVVQLPSDKVAVVSHVGGVAIAMNHFRNQHVGTDRELQAKALIKHMKREKQAVIMGDFNAEPHEKARRIIRKAGFISVFEATSQTQPNTFPTDPYWDAFVTEPPQERYRNGPVSLDDIYVRGIRVESAGTFIGDSDHVGLWARLSTAT